MNLTRLPIADAQPGMVAQVDVSGDTATITKVKRPKGAHYLKVTFVDDLGTVFARRYYDDAPDATVDILT
jgi:hypothetical protein